MKTLFASIIVAILVSTTSADICDGSQRVVWVSDPSDCRTFYLCYGKMQQKYVCPPDTVYIERGRRCVKKGSADDKCTKGETLTIPERCKRSESFFLAYDDSCSKYIDCSSKTVEECYYPFLFDQNTNRCTPPEIAECGTRLAPIDPCDYVENECESSLGCVPCGTRFPSCKGLRDGLNPWPEREGSPYFVVCKNERVVYHDQCDYEKKKEIFHPQKRACLTM